VTGLGGRVEYGVFNSEGTSLIVLTGPGFTGRGRAIDGKTRTSSLDSLDSCLAIRDASLWPLIADALLVKEAKSSGGTCAKDTCDCEALLRRRAVLKAGRPIGGGRVVASSIAEDREA